MFECVGILGWFFLGVFGFSLFALGIILGAGLILVYA